ncbi:MAG: hypothetical protein V1744_05510 [Candidatus Altiarchaeota archaeon]
MKFNAPLLLILLILTAGCINGNQTKSVSASTTTTIKAPVHTTATTTIKTTTTTEAYDETTTTMYRPANISHCLTLGDVALRDSCLYSTASRDKSMEICQKITNANLRFKCHAYLEDKAEHCDNIDVQTDKDWCYRMMAFKWNKIKYCKVIFAQNIRDKCMLDFIIDKMGERSDPTECFDIYTPALKDKCYFHEIGLYNRTGGTVGIHPRLCNLIEDGAFELQCNQTFLKN